MGAELRGIAALTALLALGCGGEPASAPDDALESAAAVAVSNRPPVIERLALVPTRLRPGDRVTVEVEISDPEEDPVELVYEWRVDGRRTGEGLPWLQVEDTGKGSRIELTVVAHDGHQKSAPEHASARVGNQAPVLLGVVLEPLGEVSVLQDVSASPKARDADGDPLEYRYAWRVNDEQIDAEGPVLSATHFRRGDRIELTVVASDGESESEPLRSQPFEVGNAPPRILSQPGAIGEDGVFRYEVRAEDPDGDRTLRYRLLEGPRGMRIDLVDGELEWAPQEDQAGRHAVRIEVDDRAGGSTAQSFQLEVEFAETSAPAAPAP